MYMTKKTCSKFVCQEMSNYECNRECLGPKCAAWRWTESILNDEDQDKRRGYCGKIGKPLFGV